MPRRDGTGPMGIGSMTGRGLGYCNTNRAFYTDTSPRYGFGLGCRRGFGRFMFSYNLNAEHQRSFLMEQKSILESQLKAIKKQLEQSEE